MGQLASPAYHNSDLLIVFTKATIYCHKTGRFTLAADDHKAAPNNFFSPSGRSILLIMILFSRV